MKPTQTVIHSTLDVDSVFWHLPISGLAQVPQSTCFKIFGLSVSNKYDLSHRARFDLWRPDCRRVLKVHSPLADSTILGTMKVRELGLKIRLYIVRFGPRGTMASSKDVKNRILECLCQAEHESRASSFPRDVSSFEHLPFGSSFLVQAGMMQEALRRLGDGLDQGFSLFAQAYDLKILPDMRVHERGQFRTILEGLRRVFPTHWQAEVDVGAEFRASATGKEAMALLLHPVHFSAWMGERFFPVEKYPMLFTTEVSGYRGLRPRARGARNVVAGRKPCSGLVLLRAYYPVLEAISTNKQGLLLNQARYRSMGLEDLDASVTHFLGGYASFLESGKKEKGKSDPAAKFRAAMDRARTSGLDGKDEILKSLLHELASAGERPMPVRIECRFDSLDEAPIRQLFIELLDLVLHGGHVRCVASRLVSGLARVNLKSMARLAGSALCGAHTIREEWNRSRLLFRSGFDGILSNMTLSFDPARPNLVSRMVELQQSISMLNLFSLRYVSQGRVDLERREAQLGGRLKSNILITDLYQFACALKPVESEAVALILANWQVDRMDPVSMSRGELGMLAAKAILVAEAGAILLRLSRAMELSALKVDWRALGLHPVVLAGVEHDDWKRGVEEPIRTRGRLVSMNQTFFRSLGKHVQAQPMAVEEYVAGRFNLELLGQGRPSAALYLMHRLVYDMPEGMSFDRVELQEYLVQALSEEEGWDYGLTFRGHSLFPLATKTCRPFVRLLKADHPAPMKAASWHSLRVPIADHLRDFFDRDIQPRMSIKPVGPGGKLSLVEQALIVQGKSAMNDFRSWLACPYNGFWRPVGSELRLYRSPATLKDYWERAELSCSFDEGELLQAKLIFLNGKIDQYPKRLPSMVSDATRTPQLSKKAKLEEEERITIPAQSRRNILAHPMERSDPEVFIQLRVGGRIPIEAMSHAMCNRIGFPHNCLIGPSEMVEFRETGEMIVPLAFRKQLLRVSARVVALVPMASDECSVLCVVYPGAWRRGNSILIGISVEQSGEELMSRLLDYLFPSESGDGPGQFTRRQLMPAPVPLSGLSAVLFARNMANEPEHKLLKAQDSSRWLPTDAEVEELRLALVEELQPTLADGSRSSSDELAYLGGNLAPAVYGHTLPRRYDLVEEDVGTLAPAQWVNDAVIEWRLRQLQSQLPPSSLSTALFSSQFAERLRVNRLALAEGVDIFAQDLLLLPINVSNSHWIVAAVVIGHGSVHEKQVLIATIDSFNEERAEVVQILEGWLLREAAKANIRARLERRRVVSPRQSNNWDCGVCTLVAIEAMARNPEGAVEVVRRGGSMESWYATRDVEELRARLFREAMLEVHK